MISPEQVETVDDFSPFGVHAFTTTRAIGSFSTASDEPVREVIGRWDALRATAAERGVLRLATASQVHGSRIIAHDPGWDGLASLTPVRTRFSSWRRAGSSRQGQVASSSRPVSRNAISSVLSSEPSFTIMHSQL